MTFDDFVIKFDGNTDLWIELKEDIDAWNAGGEDFPKGTGGPRFEELLDLMDWQADNWWHPTHTPEWLWETYLEVREVTAAGVSFDAAVEAAMTRWCDGRCGRAWNDYPGQCLPDEIWLTIAKKEDALCSYCVEERLSRVEGVS